MSHDPLNRYNKRVRAFFLIQDLKHYTSLFIDSIASISYISSSFLSNVRNFIDQNETKLETSKSGYTGMYNREQKE